MSENNNRQGRFSIYWMILKDMLNLSRQRPGNLNNHLDEAINWLCRAQDGTPDDGFARAFNLKNGWEASYPETTGYIIPTIIDYHNIAGRHNLLDRAYKACDWLIEQQFPEGGIPGGTIETIPKSPTIFNTGQVIFGWVSAYRQSGNEEYKDAADRACHWLEEVQDGNGAWTKHRSVVATYSMNTYNARTAWAMIQGSEITGKKNYREAALKNIDWVLTQRNQVGWYSDNCLTDNNKPLTHTIAYTIRGVLEAGLAVSNDEYINMAADSASQVLKQLNSNGYLPGRFDAKWNSSANYSCLTGACQMAVIWSKLFSIGKGEEFREGAKKAIEYVCSTQNINSENLGIRGGIKGSFPINGDYGRFEYLNWAAKFLADAIIAYLNVAKTAANKSSALLNA